MRRAKIVATLGPSSNSEEMIRDLIEAGANTFRLNFSHGSHEDHRIRLETIRRVSRELERPVAILQDLSGPKIRTGRLRGREPIELQEGASVLLSNRAVEGTEDILPISYPHLVDDVEPGHRILIDDGNIELEAIEAEGSDLRCRVLHGGLVKERKGVNFPGVPLRVYAPTEKDRRDLAFGLALDVDYVALSFVRRAEDILATKRLMAQEGKEVPLIAKIEKPEALEDLPAILEASEGVMVARGDLGVEMPPERVPILQKQIVEQANQCDCLCIIATQMLESMMHHPRPTRAEASDVANAIIDGADAVMLSGETAVGEFPVETVRMMGRIVQEAESSGRPQMTAGLPRRTPPTYAHAIAHAAREIAHDLEIKAIVAFTRSGFSARLISKERPRVPILAITPSDIVWRQLGLVWGVTPICCPFVQGTDGMIHVVEAELVARGLVQPGDLIVIMGGMPMTTRGRTNFIKVQVVESTGKIRMIRPD
ncbi:MAG: pyruvate kinase [Chloroflexia bacterium]|nr:pyruvate kinase [Chloroflexia bacterium]